jgi:hypothetical protein
MKNITEFKKDDIIVKVFPSTVIETVSDGMFSAKKEKTQSRSYMNSVFKLVGHGNNFAYLEMLDNKYSSNNKTYITKICIDEYGNGWQELIIPEGLTLEEILNK